jgi:arylsulfatase A-like enzyme/Flp pilus assembly protein TadD
MKSASRNSPVPRKKSRHWLWIPGLMIVLAVVAYWGVRHFVGGGPRQSVIRGWKDLGVDKPNVVVVTLDTTRADHLGPYGYAGVRTPVLDDLARRGTLFEECASVVPLTLPSHSTIFTGVYPTFHGVRVNGNAALSDEQTTLAEVMTGRGYACGAFIGAFVLDGRWGLKQGFQYYDDQFDLKKYKQLDLGMVQRPGNIVMDAALDWLESRKDRPFFAWIHLYDPHMPYAPPEPYFSEYQKGGPAGLYDGEIAFMDFQIGRLTTWMEKSGLDRNTVLLLVGDHGEGLGSHGESSHGYFIYDYALHVPLIVVTPFTKAQGVRVSTQVSTADVFATILDLAKIPVPPQSQGRSLVPLIFGRGAGEAEFAYSESMSPNLQFGWAPLQALRTIQYKFINAPRLELYDLERDADESNNIAERNPAVVRDFKARLDRFLEETSRGAPKLQAANFDKETVARLAALGYVATPVSSKKSPSQALADPKDKLAVFQSVQKAGEMVMSEEYSSAVAILQSVLKEDPETVQALILLSTCQTELGHKEEAKATLNVVLKNDPEDIQALISLANILSDEGRTDDVVALCKRTLALDERNVQAYMLLGEIYLSEQKQPEALPFLEKAVEIQPKLARNNLNLAAGLVGLKQYARAESILKNVVRDNPKYPFANFNLGLCFEEQGRWEEARKVYADEVTVFPHEFQARFNLGKILLRLGDKQGYLDEMREVMTIAPRRAEGYLFLARGLLNEPGSIEEVRPLVDKGLSLAPTDDLKAFGYFLLADYYNRIHQPEKMQAALEKAGSFKSK